MTERSRADFGERRAISIQLHPEFEPDYALALIEARRGNRYTDAQADAAGGVGGEAVAGIGQGLERLQRGQQILGVLRVLDAVLTDVLVIDLCQLVDLVSEGSADLDSDLHVQAKAEILAPKIVVVGG